MWWAALWPSCSLKGNMVCPSVLSRLPSLLRECEGENVRSLWPLGLAGSWLVIGRVRVDPAYMWTHQQGLSAAPVLWVSLYWTSDESDKVSQNLTATDASLHPTDLHIPNAAPGWWSKEEHRCLERSLPRSLVVSKMFKQPFHGPKS